MKRLMTREFSKWADKYDVTVADLVKVLDEVESGIFDADLGGHVLKKRVRFQDRGKRGSGRAIICFKKAHRAIFVHGYAKNQKANVSKKELEAFRKVAEILLNLSQYQVENSIRTGTFIEVANNE